MAEAAWLIFIGLALGLCLGWWAAAAAAAGVLSDAIRLGSTIRHGGRQYRLALNTCPHGHEDWDECPECGH